MSGTKKDAKLADRTKATRKEAADVWTVPIPWTRGGMYLTNGIREVWVPDTFRFGL